MHTGRAAPKQTVAASTWSGRWRRGHFRIKFVLQVVEDMVTRGIRIMCMKNRMPADRTLARRYRTTSYAALFEE